MESSTNYAARLLSVLNVKELAASLHPCPLLPLTPHSEPGVTTFFQHVLFNIVNIDVVCETVESICTCQSLSWSSSS